MIRLMLALAALPAFAQQFEVASIKMIEPSRNGPFPTPRSGGPGTNRPTRIDYPCAYLVDVMVDAFGPGYRTAGFEKAGLKLVTISATLLEGTTKDQLRVMLQNLLVERFQLKVHRETREGKAFELTVEAAGHKLKENAAESAADADARLQPLGVMDGYNMPELPNTVPGTVRSYYSPGKARARGYAAPVSELVGFLVPILNGPVVDHTGLTGKYDFKLDCEGPEYKMVGPDGTIRQSTAEEFFPPIPSALSKQLGLHLTTKKLPVEFVVFDSIADKPTEN
jgi:uncharacterized protein (TIGR03435 family)